MIARARHLVGRFARSLWPGGPAAADEAWVADVLQPGERRLWERLSRADRRHSIAVAREVERRLAGTPRGGEPVWLAAALLHDVGKWDAHLGTYGRSVATLAGAVAGHGAADAWASRRGFTRKVGLYLRHGELGADMIRVAGGREEAAVWAAVHHRPGTWDALGFPGDVVVALVAADGEGGAAPRRRAQDHRGRD